MPLPPTALRGWCDESRSDVFHGRRDVLADGCANHYLGYAMTNAIPNVPRELLERVLDYDGAVAIRQNARHELRALLSAPSPAGVDGLNTDRNAAFKACPESGCDWGSFYLGWKARGEVEQAIIDGLRAEIGAQRVKTCIALKERNDAREERDQQAQRIGELEGLLLRVQVSLSLDDTEWGYSGAEKYKLLADIRAALSAGKEVE